MSRASLSLAGFQVTFIGRFWVTAEAEVAQEMPNNAVLNPVKRLMCLRSFIVL